MLDEWTTTGAVLDETALDALKPILDDESPVIVEHWFYRGSSAPDRLIFDDHDALVRYVRTRGKAGDALYFWVFSRCCTDTNTVAHGKLPDAEGRTPVGGPY